MTRRLPEGAPILTAAAMRAAEARTFAGGVSQDALMERAGIAVAQQVLRLAGGRPVLVLAGPGNNGGDAFVAARWLAERGHDVSVAQVAGKSEGSAARMCAAWTGGCVALAQARPRPVLVDGLFGTGLSRALEPAIATPLRHLRAAATLSIAIDVPSGLATDDGADLGAAGADVTVALGALKPAHVLGHGVAACGHVLLADIGLSIESPWRTIARPQIPAPPVDAQKYSRGMVAVAAGAMPGAARLAAGAAARGGAGYVVLAGGAGGPDALVHRAAPDAALFADARIGALLIGPGLGRDDRARGLLDGALASGRRLVMDGDALTLLGRDAIKRVSGVDAILTPHSGEFDRMFGAGDGSKIERTQAAARACGAVVVHKGADTVIADPHGRVVVSASATPWLSTAGSGDVLAGLVAARLAVGAGRPAEEAVWLHTHAAAVLPPGFLADDLVGAIPAAFEACL